MALFTLYIWSVFSLDESSAFSCIWPSHLSLGSSHNLSPKPNNLPQTPRNLPSNHRILPRCTRSFPAALSLKDWCFQLEEYSFVIKGSSLGFLLMNLFSAFIVSELPFIRNASHIILLRQITLNSYAKALVKCNIERLSRCPRNILRNRRPWRRFKGRLLKHFFHMSSTWIMALCKLAMALQGNLALELTEEMEL